MIHLNVIGWSGLEASTMNNNVPCPQPPQQQ